MQVSRYRGWIIVATFVIALMLTAMPVPDWAVAWRPAWVAMVLIYWCMALPERVGLLVGWCLGLLLDVMGGAALGQNALGLTLIALITVSNHYRIRVFPLGQQALLVGFIVILYLAVTYLIRMLTGRNPDPVASWLPAITSMLLWPWLFIVLRDVRRRAQLS